jgi:hypothetical protein
MILVMDIKRLVIQICRRIGFYPSPLIDRADLETFNSLLRPVLNGHELIRIGSDNDGGYLVPDDLAGINKCISPGVSDNMSFEIDIWNKFKIKSYMYDGSCEAPSEITSNQKFYKLFVGSVDKPNYISMSQIINDHVINKNDDLLGQIDIEEGEYEFIKFASNADLSRFRILIIEFHDLERWLQSRFFQETIQPIFEKLNLFFDLVHNHRNTACGEFTYKGAQFSRVVELTFHRKDRAKSYDGFATLPHPLDRDNF